MQRPDLALWRTVLGNGLHDATKGVDVEWLGSDEFAEVCSLAEVEPDAVLRAFREQRFKRFRATMAA
jgi:hypothetical protein